MYVCMNVYVCTKNKLLTRFHQRNPFIYLFNECAKFHRSVFC